MSSSFRIVNGKVQDPINGIDGRIQDICVQDGKIVEDVSPEARRIDVSGMVVMPGGIDMHCHIAGSKVNLARKLQPEDHRHDVHPRTPFTRSGTGGTVPSTFTTGYRYAMLGYTTAMEAAVAPMGARHVLEELNDTPILDKGYFMLLGDNLMLYKLLNEGRHEEFRQAVAWWFNASKAYAPKLVNPGGGEPWKHRNSNVVNLDDEVDYFNVSPRQIIEALTTTANDLGLPHPAHIHCNNLGIAGNYETTLNTMRTITGRRAHITHIQFHSYGGEFGGKPTSKAKDIAEYINAHPEVSADVGQVMFGKATGMTADAPLAWMLQEVSGNKWINCDIENESGCGVVPIVYQDTNYVHALQWGIGLELFLLSDDPWRMVLSTDHPNGGSFLSYPKLIRLLMDRQFRNEQIRSVNQKAMKNTVLLDDLEREYTLQEIAIITRAAPARLLGLDEKGHLGPGADADITIYMESENKEEMFSTPRFVFKDGQLIIEDGEFRSDHEGRILHVAPDFDPAIEEVLRPFFEDYYTIEFANYAVGDEYLHRHQVVETTA
jgi:formylmethanofuran dehydrogenase subunit A